MFRITILILIFFSAQSNADTDTRQLVKLPKSMQEHMLSNMRDHLETINKILIYLGNDELDKAAELAEQRLGMSSLGTHGAAHMAKFMPESMRKAGTAMHRKASLFALKAEEGDQLPSYKMLSEITSACVNCHAAYRIK